MSPSRAPWLTRIVPAATPETLQEIADQLGVYDPCAIACEPFRQWVIEDNFVNGRRTGIKWAHSSLQTLCRSK